MQEPVVQMHQGAGEPPESSALSNGPPSSQCGPQHRQCISASKAVYDAARCQSWLFTSGP